ncbi:hypothetical protein Agub_g11776, partial [Astrephomene gubernaculifera]
AEAFPALRRDSPALQQPYSTSSRIAGSLDHASSPPSSSLSRFQRRRRHSWQRCRWQRCWSKEQQLDESPCPSTTSTTDSKSAGLVRMLQEPQPCRRNLSCTLVEGCLLHVPRSLCLPTAPTCSHSYKRIVRLQSVQLKILGREPEDLAPGYRKVLQALARACGCRLAGVYVRQGCIELTLDLETEEQQQQEAEPGEGDGAPDEYWQEVKPSQEESCMERRGSSSPASNTTSKGAAGSTSGGNGFAVNNCSNSNGQPGPLPGSHRNSSSSSIHSSGSNTSSGKLRGLELLSSQEGMQAVVSQVVKAAVGPATPAPATVDISLLPLQSAACSAASAAGFPSSLRRSPRPAEEGAAAMPGAVPMTTHMAASRGGLRTGLGLGLGRLPPPLEGWLLRPRGARGCFTRGSAGVGAGAAAAAGGGSSGSGSESSYSCRSGPVIRAAPWSKVLARSHDAAQAASSSASLPQTPPRRPVISRVQPRVVLIPVVPPPGAVAPPDGSEVRAAPAAAGAAAPRLPPQSLRAGQPRLLASTADHHAATSSRGSVDVPGRDSNGNSNTNTADDDTASLISCMSSSGFATTSDSAPSSRDEVTTSSSSATAHLTASSPPRSCPASEDAQSRGPQAPASPVITFRVDILTTGGVLLPVEKAAKTTSTTSTSAATTAPASDCTRCTQHHHQAASAGSLLKSGTAVHPQLELLARCNGHYLPIQTRVLATSSCSSRSSSSSPASTTKAPTSTAEASAAAAAAAASGRAQDGAVTITYEVSLLALPPELIPSGTSTTDHSTPSSIRTTSSCGTVLLLDLRWRGAPAQVVPVLLLLQQPQQPQQQLQPQGLAAELAAVAAAWRGPSQELDGLLYDAGAWLAGMAARRAASARTAAAAAGAMTATAGASSPPSWSLLLSAAEAEETAALTAAGGTSSSSNSSTDGAAHMQIAAAAAARQGALVVDGLPECVGSGCGGGGVVGHGEAAYLPVLGASLLQFAHAMGLKGMAQELQEGMRRAGYTGSFRSLLLHTTETHGSEQIQPMHQQHTDPHQQQLQQALLPQPEEVVDADISPFTLPATATAPAAAPGTFTGSATDGSSHAPSASASPLARFSLRSGRKSLDRCPPSRTPDTSLSATFGSASYLETDPECYSPQAAAAAGFGSPLSTASSVARLPDVLPAPEVAGGGGSEAAASLSCRLAAASGAPGEQPPRAVSPQQLERSLAALGQAHKQGAEGTGAGGTSPLQQLNLLSLLELFFLALLAVPCGGHLANQGSSQAAPGILPLPAAATAALVVALLPALIACAAGLLQPLLRQERQHQTRQQETRQQEASAGSLWPDLLRLACSAAAKLLLLSGALGSAGGSGLRLGVLALEGVGVPVGCLLAPDKTLTLATLKFPIFLAVAVVAAAGPATAPSAAAWGPANTAGPEGVLQVVGGSSGDAAATLVAALWALLVAVVGVLCHAHLRVRLQRAAVQSTRTE